jgi:hypothetical protein
MSLIEIFEEMKPLDFLSLMVMQPEIEAKLGPARADMVLAEAKHKMWGCPRHRLLEAVVGVEEAKVFDFRRDMTAWELQLGDELADLYRPDYKEMARVNLEAVKKRKEEAEKAAKEAAEKAEEELDKSSAS